MEFFKLSKSFIDDYIDKQPTWGPIGYVVYKRTYARPLDGGGTEEFWQTIQRVVEGAYTLQKDHCKRLKLPWNEAKAQRSAQEMYRLMWEFKFLPPGRGLWAMGTQFVYERGSAALNNCFASETEIITEEGIKTIGSIAGTTQRLLTKGGKWVDAPILSFGKQRLYKITLQRQGIEKVIYATKDHRWFAKDRRSKYRHHGYAEFTTEELRPNIHRLEYVFGQGIKNLSGSPFGIAHGFVFGDGTTTGSRFSTRAMLIGHKDKALLKYFAACPQRKVANINAIEISALPNNYRELPSIHENTAYLLGWLMGYFAADGSVNNGMVTISSAKQENIKFVKDVCSKIGIGTYSFQIDDRTSNLTNKQHRMYRLNLMRDTLTESFFLIKAHRDNFIANKSSDIPKRNWVVKAVEPTQREEEVFCATVPDTHSFALADNILTGNCAFVSSEEINTSFSSPFTFMMDMLMLGVGVSGDTKGAGKVTIRSPKATERPFIVEDTREGWVELLRTVLEAFVGNGQLPTTIDYSKVRPEGAPIKGFGGVASGPGPLNDMIQDIIKLLMPIDDVPYKIKSSQIVDIFNLIGRCVVAGNVRRSAELMLGDPTDIEFLALKRDKEKLMSHRWASNNSIFATVGMDYKTIAKNTAVNGEPGFFWLENARAYGRMKDQPDWKDMKVGGVNPCITGDTTIFTSLGPKKVTDLIDIPFEHVENGNVYHSKGFFSTGTKPVYLLSTKEGYTVKVTADHKIKIAKHITPKKRYDDFLQASDLIPGDKIVLTNHVTIDHWTGFGTEEMGWLIGSLIGDGCLTNKTARVDYWGEDSLQMADKAKEKIKSLGGDPRYHKMRTGSYAAERNQATVLSKQLATVAERLDITPDKQINSDKILYTSSSFHIGFLRGLFDADGCVEGSQNKGVSIRLAAINKQHLTYAQQMLMHLGIVSTLYQYRKKRGISVLPNGKGGSSPYQTHTMHELVVANDNVARFARIVSFDEPQKREKLERLLLSYKRKINRERFIATFDSLTYVGTQPVFDCTVEGVHSFDANGITVHNCSEQSLESFELCNLVETFPSLHENLKEWHHTLKYAYLYAKSVTLLLTHDERTNAVMGRNRRIGVSITGIIDTFNKYGRRNSLMAFDREYQYLKSLDEKYSDWLCIPHSIKISTVKPSGTVSLLPGVNPGVHYPEAEYIIRRVRLAKNSPLVSLLKKAGYHIEPNAYDTEHGVVVEFPVKEQYFVKGKHDVSIWEQVKNAVDMQRYWADNQVSITVSVEERELEEIPRVLEAFEDELKSISFLPSQNHGYVQAPYEMITKEKYDQMIKKIKPIEEALSQQEVNVHDTDEKFCDGDACALQ